MHVGNIARDVAMNGGKQIEKWVRKSIGPMPKFDSQKGKEMY